MKCQANGRISWFNTVGSTLVAVSVGTMNLCPPYGSD